MTTKDQCFESIEDIKVATTVQLKTFKKEDSRAAPERDRDDGMSVLKVRGRVLRRIHGNVSFSVSFKI